MQDSRYSVVQDVMSALSFSPLENVRPDLFKLTPGIQSDLSFEAELDFDLGLHIEGFQPEKYIWTTYHCRDIPFWLETLNMRPDYSFDLGLNLRPDWTFNLG